jgi:hypothetical protein
VRPPLRRRPLDASRDAELIADTVDAGLSGRCPIEEAMAA